MNAMTENKPAAEAAVTRNDLTEAVRQAAMLADVTISVWGAERSDAKVMEEVKAAKGATGNVGRVVKNLMAGADGQLKDTRSAFAQVRSIHYSLTLPWVADPHAERQRGPRLLPHLLFDRYLAALSTQKRKAMAQLDTFIADYPKLVETAKANLGGLVQASDYPSADEVRAQFRVGFDFEPIPSGASFQGLSDHVIERLAAGLKAKQERMLSSATQAMWETARERVQHIVERLSDPEAKFKSTTVENVRELITLLPGWNVAGDERASEIARDIDDMLTGIDVKSLRDDAVIRKSVAAQGQKIADKLTSWGL